MITSSYSSVRQLNQRLLLVAICISILFILLGIVVTVLIGHRIDSTERERLTIRAQNASVAIDPSAILALRGNQEDIGTDVYESLKQDMMSLRTINPDSRFVYLMGLRGENLFFYVDSEKPDSEDYSPPGQIYTETTAFEIDNYHKGLPFAEGPYTDRWGSWVSGYAPIIDPATRQTIAIIGIDINAEYWNHQILLVRLVIALITLLLCGFFITLTIALRKSTATSDILQKDNESLRASKEYLSESESIAHIGRLSFNNKTNEMSWKGEIYALFGIPPATKITPEVFFNALHPDDTRKVKTLFDAAFSTGESFECTCRVLLPYGVEKTVLMFGVVKKNKLMPYLIVATLQDITKHIAHA